MSWKLKERICGTVLLDHPYVQEQYKKYPVKNFDDWNPVNLPKTFDGVKRWAIFNTQTTHGKPYAGDWAYAFNQVFKFKINLLAYRVFFIVDLSADQVLMRIRKPPIDPNINAPSSLFTGQAPSIFNGYSLIDMVEFCYENGLCQKSCINQSLYEKAGFSLEIMQTGTFDDKLKLLDENKDRLDSGICMSTIDGKYVAQETYTIIGIALLGDEKSSMSDRTIAIKKSIYRTGPVLSGMMIDYALYQSDGLSIYEGNIHQSEMIGGHAVSILGWGNDETVGEYWIVQTYWTHFGTLGILKVKIGLGDLEKNAIELQLDIPNHPVVPDEFIMMYNTQLTNLKRLKIIKPYFYTQQTIDLLKKKEIVNLHGNYEVEALYDLNDLIPPEKFTAATIKRYFLQPKYIEISWTNYFLYFVLFFILNYSFMYLLQKK